MASDLSSGCTETIDLDEKEEGEISLEDVSSSEEGGIGHLTCGYFVKSRPQCSICKSTWGECPSWCTASFKTYCSKNQTRKDPVKGKENRHHVNEADGSTTRHVTSTLQEKNDDLVPISSDSDMEIVGLTDTSKQVTSRSKTRIKKKKKEKDYEFLTVDDLISPSSADLPITECFSTTESRDTSVAKGTGISRTHNRKPSPFRRSGRSSRVVTRSPLRKYRSPARTRSPPCRLSRSPLSRSRSPPLRRSLRRFRSPKRSGSSYGSTIKSDLRKPSKQEASSPPFTRTYIDDRHSDVTRLLKKVKRLDSVGTHMLKPGVSRSKEHQPSSLKDKLCNMLKKMSDDNDMRGFKEKSSAQVMTLNNADDEEDLALLRQKALETKQKNKSRSAEAESDRKLVITSSKTTHDDQDEEDFELRMIALRSAVIKKHQDRVQRGIQPKNKKKLQISSRSESPFTQSFLEEIPIPSDELLKFASPPNTPPASLLTDSNHIEDMDLDTDVEREKEKLPYSPTDNITVEVPIDTEMLGIEPSDVSFINLNNTNNSPNFIASNDKQNLPTDVVPPLYNGYLSPYMPSPKQFADSPTSSSGDEGFHASLIGDQDKLSSYLRNLHSNSVECDLIDGTCCQQVVEESIKCSHSPDVIPSAVPVTSEPVTSTFAQQVHETEQAQVTEQPSDDVLENMDSPLVLSGDKYFDETTSKNVNSDLPATTASEMTSSNGSTVIVDELQQTKNEDPNSSAATNGSLKPTVDNTSSEKPCQTNATEEPSYMQDLPNVSKDINKIPTLISKTLVPAAILKSNKQLQQSLPALVKKSEAQSEPTFKSAEMQPVVVIVDMNAKSNSTFKPIKLVVPAKKCGKSMLTTPIAFNDSANENLEDDAVKNNSRKTVESKHSVPNTPTSNKNETTVRKKRKRNKRNKSLDNARSISQDKKDSCTNNDINKDVSVSTTKSISQSQVTKKKSDDDNKVQEDVAEDKEPTLEVAATTQKSPLQNDSNINLENIDNLKRSDQQMSSNDTEDKQATSSISNDTEEKQAAPSISKECQEKNDMDRLSRNSGSIITDNNTIDDNKIAQATKDVNNRRQSMDEDEDELRAIVLASLTKRSTKSLDTNGVSPTILVSTQTTPQKTSTNTTLIAANTTSSQTSVLKSPKVDENISTNKVNDTIVSSVGENSMKRPNAVTASEKGPVKKVMKKMPTPISTKVVNNAKKYQNTTMQRKNLNLHDTKVLNNKLVHQDNLWQSNGPKKTSMVYATETQRIVINLGSDTDSNSETEAETEHQTKFERSKVNASDMPSVAVGMPESNTDFEKSLHKFLRDVRKEHESAAASKSTSLLQSIRKDTSPIIQADIDKDSHNVHTPLAVRHLPVSQQEEYRRLKQQILVREKLKQQRIVVNNNNSNNTNNNVGNKLLNNEVSASSSFDKEDTSTKQSQIKSKEKESQKKSLIDVKAKNDDATTNAFMLNVHRTIINHNISTSMNTKQVSSPQTKVMKKTVPNFSIRISNKNSPTQTISESRTIENSIDLANRRQSMSDKQQFRPALRTLSKDEINRKYMQVQLKQDTTERVVIINDNSKSWHETTDSQNAQSEKPVENVNNITMENTSGKMINRNDNDSSDLSSASTVILPNNLNLSVQELTDSMETTLSHSQYERERENNQNNHLTSLSILENLSRNESNASSKSNENAGDKNKIDDIWDALKKDVKEELEAFSQLSKVEQQRHLVDTEHELVTKRYNVLDHLAEMSGNLRQWDMEKDLQNSLTIEVKKLKEQLKIAEERLEQQRQRVNSMGPKISLTRQKINAGRRECFKLSRICSVLGNRLGKSYKLPAAGDQLLSEKLKEIANHTRQLSKKKLSSNDAEISMFSTSSLQRLIFLETSATTSGNDTSSQLSDTIIQNNVMRSKDDMYSSERLNDTQNVSTSDTSLSNQITPFGRNQTSAIGVESYGDEQHTPDQDKSLSNLKLSSTPISIEQTSECIQRTHRVEIPQPVAPSESGPPIVSSPRQEDEQQSINGTQSLPPPPLPATTTVTMTTTATATMTTTTATATATMTTTTATATMTTTTATATTTTTTMTMTTTTTIEPYVSILTHLKTPWNANPNGILCPYDLMGICNDKDCQFLHQSTNST